MIDVAAGRLWKEHTKRRAASGTIFHPRPAAVKLRESRHQCQADAGAGRVRRRRRPLTERLEDRRADVLGNSWAAPAIHAEFLPEPLSNEVPSGGSRVCLGDPFSTAGGMTTFVTLVGSDMEQPASQPTQNTKDAEATIVDTTDGTFIADVIEESQRRPVVVDFWAEWCAPCRTLGPILEGLADESKGAFRLAKLDVDSNPGISAHFMVQGIPAVKAFVRGQLVDEFVGSMPEPMVRKWLEPLLPTEADRFAAGAKQEAAAGDIEAAERDFREALTADPQNRDAALGLATILFERGDREGARVMAEPFAPDPEAERLLARARVAGWADVADAGTLISARRLAAGGKWREALDGMLGSMQDDPEEARASMLDVFSVLGNDDDLTREYRGRLAAVLF